MYFTTALEDLKIFIQKNRETATVYEELRPYITNQFSKPFNEVLFQYIDKKEIKDSVLYLKAGIDRRLFSKIRSDKNYHPSFKTVAMLALALELDTKDCEKLLQSAAYSLPKNKVEFLVIRYCFDHKIYDLKVINRFLSENGCVHLDEL